MPEQRPSHERVKLYLAERRASGNPPPTPEEIRAQLGWSMIQAQQKKEAR